MKGQNKKGKDDNVQYLIISGNADVLRKFANVWKSIRAKIEENTSGIVQYDQDYMRIKYCLYALSYNNNQKCFCSKW